MWPNGQEAADLVTFTEDILNGKLHFLQCINCVSIVQCFIFIGYTELKISRKVESSKSSTDHDAAWKVSKYGVYSDPYFPLFGAEKTPYLDKFHAVWV